MHFFGLLTCKYCFPQGYSFIDLLTTSDIDLDVVKRTSNERTQDA